MRASAGLRCSVFPGVGVAKSSRAHRKPYGPLGEVGDRGAVETADGTANRVVERLDPMGGQLFRAGDDPRHAAGRGTVGVGVPATLHGEPDAGAEVAVAPQ